MSAPTNVVQRIAKLLNQAENAANENEAKAFSEAAQRLATLTNIDLAVARQHTLNRERAIPVVKRITIGEKRSKGLRIYTDLFLEIARANDLKSLIYGDGIAVEVYGFQEDVEVTEALFASLSIQMASAVEEFLKGDEWKKDKVYREGKYEYYDTITGKKLTASEAKHNWDSDQRWVDGEWVPVPKITARLNFQKAFASTVGNRLSLAAMDAKAQAKAKDSLALIAPDGELTEDFMTWYLVERDFDLSEDSPKAQQERDQFLNPTGWFAQQMVTKYREYLAGQGDTTAPGTTLVLANKTKEVDEFYKSKTSYMRLRGSYGGHKTSTHAAGARSAGRTAGENARLGGGAGSLPGARKQLR